MKSFFKQLGKALCYFILFLYSQSLIAVVYQFIYGFQAGVEAKMTGQEIDMQKFSEGVLAYINEKSTDIIVISGCLTMLTLWLFFLIRKKNVLTESGVSKFSLKYVPILVVLGIALQIVCSFGLSMLPAEILADYANNLNQKFGEISFVAIIAQVIAAPTQRT